MLAKLSEWALREEVRFCQHNRFRTFSRMPYAKDPAAKWGAAWDDGDMALLPEHKVKAKAMDKTSKAPLPRGRSECRWSRQMVSDRTLWYALNEAGGLATAEALKRSQCHDLLEDFAATDAANRTKRWHGCHGFGGTQS